MKLKLELENTKKVLFGGGMKGGRFRFVLIDLNLFISLFSFGNAVLCPPQGQWWDFPADIQWFRADIDRWGELFLRENLVSCFILNSSSGKTCKMTLLGEVGRLPHAEMLQLFTGLKENFHILNESPAWWSDCHEHQLSNINNEIIICTSLAILTWDY